MISSSAHTISPSVSYVNILRTFYPRELQTNCKALAKYRVGMLRSKHYRGKKAMERIKIEVCEGKLVRYYTLRFRRVL